MIRNIIDSDISSIRFDVFISTEIIETYADVEASATFFNFDAALEYAESMLTSPFTDFTYGFISLTIVSDDIITGCTTVWEAVSEEIKKA